MPQRAAALAWAPVPTGRSCPVPSSGASGRGVGRRRPPYVAPSPPRRPTGPAGSLARAGPEEGSALSALVACAGPAPPAGPLFRDVPARTSRRPSAAPRTVPVEAVRGLPPPAPAHAAGPGGTGVPWEPSSAVRTEEPAARGGPADCRHGTYDGDVIRKTPVAPGRRGAEHGRGSHWLAEMLSAARCRLLAGTLVGRLPNATGPHGDRAVHPRRGRQLHARGRALRGVRAGDRGRPAAAGAARGPATGSRA